MEFKLSKKEEEAAKAFIKEHNHPNFNKGTIGGHIDYIFTPTSIGNALSMYCAICGTQDNITDYDTW